MRSSIFGLSVFFQCAILTPSFQQHVFLMSTWILKKKNLFFHVESSDQILCICEHFLENGPGLFRPGSLTAKIHPGWHYCNTWTTSDHIFFKYDMPLSTLIKISEHFSNTVRKIPVIMCNKIPLQNPWDFPLGSSGSCSTV